jgi:AcrR family transcriptional regulator
MRRLADPDPPIAAAEPAAAPASPRGSAARERLLAEAARVFARKGYAAASTREICDAAGANVSAIAYYFGGKEALYREVLVKPVREIVARLPSFRDPALPLRAQLHAMLGAFLAPLAAGDAEGALHMRIHLREMLEPSSLLPEVFRRDVKPHHDALVALLARHCGATGADDDLHMLAFAMIAMVNDYAMSQDCMRLLAPGVLGRADAVAKVHERLTDYALALVAFETARRRKTRPKQVRKK